VRNVHSTSWSQPEQVATYYDMTCQHKLETFCQSRLIRDALNFELLGEVQLRASGL
jgi:hypothetical protein